MMARNRIFRSAALCLTVLACLSATLLAGDKEDRIRAGVYNGNGASPACVIETYEALRIDGGIAPSLIGPDDIFNGGLDRLDVLIFPGGSGSRQYNSLGSVSAEKVRDFVVEDGKGVVGICAGAYLVSDSEGYPCLHLIGANSLDRIHDKRGSALVKVSFTEKGHKLFPEMKKFDYGYIQYHDGPVFVPASGPAGALFDELAVNESDVFHTGDAPKGMTPGKSFLLCQETGKGRVFACSGHPESTTGMRWMVARMVRWAARRESIEYAGAVTRPELGTSEIMHSDEYETELYWKLFDEDPETRIGALKALREKRYRNGFRWAAGMLRDSSPGVRAYAARVLAEAEYTAAIPDLESVIKVETDAECRQELLEHLATLVGMAADL